MLQAEHLDEGTLNAWLDGELDSDQLAEVDRHLTECDDCRRAAERAQQALEESDALIERLDPPPLVMLPEGSAMGGGNRFEPVVLIPPEPETPRHSGAPPKQARPNRPFAPPAFGRRARLTGLAAALLMAVGLGYALTRDGDAVPRDTELARAAPPAEQTFSEFERSEAAPPPPSAPAPAGGDSAVAADGANEAGDELAAGETAGAAAADADTAPSPAAAAGAAEPRQLAARTEETADARRRQTAARQAEAERQAAEDRAAAEAERDVAARTQAALERSAAAAAPPAAAAQRPAADPVSALERRAGVYSRIGLDEAQRMLGGPAHAILDLRPQFVGLAESRGVPGADPGRPLVRVVYLDPSQRLIVLDQQRQSGDLPASSDNLIVMARGGVRLWLHGAVPPATLRSIAERVR